MSNESEILIEDSASALMTLAESNPSAAFKIARLVSLAVDQEKQALKIMGMYKRKEISLKKALEMIDEFPGSSN